MKPPPSKFHQSNLFVQAAINIKTMTQYWYFGIRKKVSIVDTTGRTRNVPQVLWSPTIYSNAVDAAQAVAKAMITRPGVSFFIQGFDRKLRIQPDGTCTGFELIKEGVQ